MTMTTSTESNSALWGIPHNSNAVPTWQSEVFVCPNQSQWERRRNRHPRCRHREKWKVKTGEKRPRDFCNVGWPKYRSLLIFISSIYIYIYIYIYIHIYTMYVGMYVCMYVCMHVCMYAWMDACMHLSIYLSIYPSIYLSIYLSMFACMLCYVMLCYVV